MPATATDALADFVAETRFADIPEDVVKRGKDEEALQLVLKRLKHPDEFLAKVQLLYRNPEQSSYDVLDFKDGRVFERYSQPQQISGENCRQGLELPGCYRKKAVGGPSSTSTENGGCGPAGRRSGARFQ